MEIIEARAYPEHQQRQCYRMTEQRHNERMPEPFCLSEKVEMLDCVATSNVNIPDDALGDHGALSH